MLHDGPECFEQKLTSKSFQGVEIEMVYKVVSLLELDVLLYRSTIFVLKLLKFHIYITRMSLHDISNLHSS